MNQSITDANISKSDYEVVYKAVDNHNQFKIDDGLTERELLFAKLISYKARSKKI